MDSQSQMAVVDALDYLYRLQVTLSDTKPLITGDYGDLIKYDDASNWDEFLAGMHERPSNASLLTWHSPLH